jgi:hypothetical protein
MSNDLPGYDYDSDKTRLYGVMGNTEIEDERKR